MFTKREYIGLHWQYARMLSCCCNKLQALLPSSDNAQVIYNHTIRLPTGLQMCKMMYMYIGLGSYLNGYNTCKVKVKVWAFE